MAVRSLQALCGAVERSHIRVFAPDGTLRMDDGFGTRGGNGDSDGDDDGDGDGDPADQWQSPALDRPGSAADDDTSIDGDDDDDDDDNDHHHRHRNDAERSATH